MDEGYLPPGQFIFGAVTSVLIGLLMKAASRPAETEGRYTMVHLHGEHDCYCPVCGSVVTVAEGVQCAGVNCPDCGTRMRAVDIGEWRTVAQEIVGYSANDFANALELMESSIDFGEKARITLCTEALPTQEELDSIYWGMIAESCHVSYPTARVIEGIPTTEFTIRKGSPQWQVALIGVLVPLFTIGLIVFGITKIEAISKALVPLMLITIGGLIILAAVLRKPAEKYLERAGTLPRLPETKKTLAAR